jgi:beta-lactamase regulating signal transducer with metallopeptidase domain
MQTFLAVSLSNAVMATVLALLAAAVGRLYRRPALIHVLWLLVLLKLVTPPLVILPLTWPEALPAAPVLPAAEQPDSEAVASAPEPNITEPIFEEWNLLDPVPAAFPLKSEPAAVLDPPAATPQAGYGWSLDTWVSLLGLVWLCGSVALVTVAAVRLYRFHRLLRFGGTAPCWLQARAQEIARRLGLTRCPLLWIVPGRISPLLWALGGRVRLVLPAHLLDGLNAEQQATLLAHELAHARRHDHWVRWLELVTTSLYWWHPVAWWARREIQQVEEECCDAWVVWLLPAAAKAYARALLQTVDFLDARPALPPLASGIGHVPFLKRRLTMIVRQPFCPRLPWPLYLGALVVGLLVLPLAPHPLAAKSPSALPVAVDDDDAPGDRVKEQPGRDLERRLEALERKMEKVLQALERADRNRPATAPREAEQRAREMEQRARDIERRAQERARDMEKRALEQAKQAEQRAKERARRAEQKADTKGEPKPEKGKEMTKPRIQIEIQGLDAKSIQDLNRKIEEMVKQTINPERMKELQKQIDETVNKNLSPERMKDLDRKIEELVNKNINPQRIEALAKQIEETINRTLNAEQRQRGKQSSKATVKSPKPDTKQPRKAGSATGRGRDDLERRLELLEQRMEKVLKALEDSRKSRQEEEEDD